MPISNHCEIIITTGPNTTKMCKNVNKYCRHKQVICHLCQTVFGHQSSLDRHIQKNHKERKKIRVVKKDKISEIQKELEELKQKYEKQYNAVSERIEKVENEPRNIIVIGDEQIFFGLVNKMGKQRAMSFLLDNLNPKDSINIIDKMYLEGIDRNEYPIACIDDYKFRYLNHSGDIVDDKGGNKIVSKLEKDIHTAMIEANNSLIHHFVSVDDNVPLFNVYNIGEIQQKLGSYNNCKDSDKLRNALAKRVYNTEHPFFRTQQDE